MTNLKHPVPCPDCPLRTKKAFRPFTEPELKFVTGFKSGEMQVQAGHDILLQDNNSAQIFTVFAGWVFRYTLLADGRRQILNFGLPGDLIGLQGSVLDVMEHSVQALTDVNLCVFPRSKLWDLYKEQPGLGFDITWLASHEESLVDENLASVGQRTAIERLAFLFLHLHSRLEGLDLVESKSCAFPLTQQHIADATGLSLVHTNKTLRRLIKNQMVGISGGKLTLHDRQGLADLCDYDRRKHRPRPLI